MKVVVHHYFILKIKSPRTTITKYICVILNLYFLLKKNYGCFCFFLSRQSVVVSLERQTAAIVKRRKKRKLIHFNIDNKMSKKCHRKKKEFLKKEEDFYTIKREFLNVYIFSNTPFMIRSFTSSTEKMRIDI
jgi:hypothetical protein